MTHAGVIQRDHVPRFFRPAYMPKIIRNMIITMVDSGTGYSPGACSSRPPSMVSSRKRAGIQSVPAGQVEAARSLGMSSARTMVFIVIPQAFRIVLPPLTNELILLTKDSSLVYLLGYTASTVELTSFGRQALNQEKNMTPLVVISLCYLLITVPLSIVVRRMEARAGRAR